LEFVERRVPVYLLLDYLKSAVGEGIEVVRTVGS